MKLEDLDGRATINVDEVAELFKISRGSAYEACRNGTLPVLRLGRRLLVPVPALLQLLGVSDLSPESSNAAEGPTALAYLRPISRGTG